ncbi:FHA domain-containing protein [Actinocorallia aurantiaca]|uniref:FHA domain-containing protein n=1 Tax=Actinocorallia aurantiaca TaxID=46204 RepID=A0ABN3UC59_9ACTN
MTPSVRPLRGEGIVASGNGLLMVCADGASGTERLLQAFTEVAEAGGGGHDLARRVARILSALLPEPHSCAVAGPAEGGVAVLVSGGATARITGPAGEVGLDGRDALTWTDRLVGGRVDQIELRLPGASAGDTRWRLDRGIVPGGGLLCLTGSPGTGRAAEVEGPTARASEVEGPTARDGAAPGRAEPVQVANVTLVEDYRDQPFESVLLLPSEQAPSPPPRPASAPEPDSRPLVWGADCKNGHFNDPRVQYCGICGIAMVQMSLIPRQAPRPPLGVLLLDDGATFRLDTGYVAGRSPEPAAEVRDGTARPILMTDPEGSVSRRHVKVVLDQWDVRITDLGSVNGTFVTEPGLPERRLRQGETVTLCPGSLVRVGGIRTFRYESHRKS